MGGQGFNSGVRRGRLIVDLILGGDLETFKNQTLEIYFDVLNQIKSKVVLQDELMAIGEDKIVSPVGYACRKCALEREADELRLGLESPKFRSDAELQSLLRESASKLLPQLTQENLVEAATRLERQM